MADKKNVSVGKLIQNSWDFMRKNASWLWQIGLLLALPSIIQSLITNPNREITEEDITNIGDLGAFTEMVFGVSLAELGVLLMLWLVISLIYNTLVYGGSIGSLLPILRKKEQGSTDFSSVIAEGTKHFGSVLIASILVFIIIALGTLLLVIPGIIAGFLLIFTIHYVVDKNLSATEAAKASYRTAADNAGTILVTLLTFFAVAFAVSIVGGIVLTPFGGRFLLLLQGLLSAAIATYGLIVTTKLYIELAK